MASIVRGRPRGRPLHPPAEEGAYLGALEVTQDLMRELAAAVRVVAVAPGHERCTINPATRVADLLEPWPRLEPVLVARTPAFRPA